MAKATHNRIAAALRFLIVGIALAAGLIFAGGHTLAWAQGEPEHVAAGHDLVIQAGQTAHGDVSVAKGNLTVNGRVEGNATVTQGNADIEGEITGDLDVTDGSITLGPKSSIGGKVLGVRATLVRDPAAQVRGAVSVQTPEPSLLNGLSGSVVAPSRDEGGAPWEQIGPLLGWGLVSIIVVALAVILMGIAPRRVRIASATLELEGGPSVVVGLITAFVLGPLVGLLCIVLMVSMVGWVLIPVVAVVVGAALLMGLVVISLWLGRRVYDTATHEPTARFSSSTIQMLLGMGVLLSSILIPVALLPGWIGGVLLGLAYFAACIGLGSFVLSRMGTLAPPKMMRRYGRQTSGLNRGVRYTSSTYGFTQQPHGAGNTEPLGPLPPLPRERD